MSQPVDLRVAPPPSTAAVRDRSRRQGRRDTAPELAVRRRLHARGVRFRVGVRPCRETRARGDLVWKGRRLVVFIDGRRTPLPPTARRLAAGPCRGAEAEQLAGNAARDRRADAVLTGLGWRVLRFWEHEDPDAIADRICRELRQPTGSDRGRPGRGGRGERRPADERCGGRVPGRPFPSAARLG